MKKLLILLLALTSISVAFADNSAKVKIKLSSAAHDNRYYLCMPNLGCLSILAAQKGKVFSFYRPIIMNTIYIANMNANYKLSAQGLPRSCKGTIDSGKTVTIFGTIVAEKNNNARIKQLHCTIR